MGVISWCPEVTTESSEGPRETRETLNTATANYRRVGHTNLVSYFLQIGLQREGEPVDDSLSEPIQECDYVESRNSKK